MDAGERWVDKRNQYPYVSGSGDEPACDASKQRPKAFNIVDWHLLGTNEEYVAGYVARYGPVVIGADATSAWQSYKGGVLTAGCGEKRANHAIQIVGYGSEAGQDYWLIRNSWGPSWGEEGYLRLARGSNCNDVVGHVTSALFGERSPCLEECGARTCCGSDCCDVDGSETCCSDGAGGSTGCATVDMTCCGAEGGHRPCSDSSLCGGGDCCDGDKMLMPDAKGKTTCCPPDLQCGDVCHTGEEPFEVCCNGHIGSIMDSCCDKDQDCHGSTCCDGIFCGPFTQCNAATKTCERREEMV